jgi:two-component sensor histidine kinase
MHAHVGRTSNPGADATRLPARTLSLRAHFLLLVAALLLPAFAAAGLLLWQSNREAYRVQERELTAGARALALVVDRQLSEQVGLLRALQTSAPLRNGDWAGFTEQSRVAMAGSRSWVVVRLANGQQVVNTLAPNGVALPRVSLPSVPPNRPPRADGIRISRLAMGAVAKKPVITIVKEVRLADGRQAYLNIVTPADVFSENLRRQGLSPTWTATILDGDHRVIARNRQEVRFRGHSATQDMARLLETGRSGAVWSHTLDGVRTRSAYEPVADTDWHVIVAVPKRELETSARLALWGGGVAALLLLLAGGAAALGYARMLGLSVKRLQTATMAGADGFLRPEPSPVREFNDLAAAFEAAAARVQEEDSRRQLLINELNHRVKNTLATLQSVANHSRKSALSVGEFHASLEGRIMAMAAAHELLTSTSWGGADLRELAKTTLRPFESPRLAISGPKVQVTPTHALNLSLILYELATNAAKYGALSGPHGAADLSWSRRPDGIRVEWIESGGPPVRAPTRVGFGSRLFDKARAALEPATLDYAPTGLRCTLTVEPTGT